MHATATVSKELLAKSVEMLKARKHSQIYADRNPNAEGYNEAIDGAVKLLSVLLDEPTPSEKLQAEYIVKNFQGSDVVLRDPNEKDFPGETQEVQAPDLEQENSR